MACSCDGNGKVRQPLRVGKPDPELAKLHHDILLDLGHCVSNSLKELRSFTEGKLNDWDAGRIRALTSIARLAPKVLPLIEQEKELTQAVCPECIICEGWTGQHWAHDCPLINREEFKEKYVFDYKTRKAYERSELGEAFPTLFGITPYAPGTEEYQQWWEEHGHKHYGQEVMDSSDNE